MTDVEPTPNGPGGTSPGGNRSPRADPGADLIGTVLAGRYRILDKLGEGAMGAVYLGEHLKIGRHDAIKVLKAELSFDREAIARFNRGARNVSAINHPNVCTIYDYSDTDDGLLFLAMEYVPGASLKEVLDQEGPLPLSRAADIARQVADALQAAHDAGIVHRDLKPGNIMLMVGREGADDVRVVDFDIAKGSQEGEESEVTRLGFVVGTPEYMSPEQLMGERLDGRSDIYSLGIVLFRMLTGSLPFRADTTHDLMLQRLTAPPLRLDEVVPGHAFPPRLQAALDRALARNAADRPASAAEFGREIAAAVAEVEVGNKPGRRARTGREGIPDLPRRATEEVPPTRVAAFRNTAAAGKAAVPDNAGSSRRKGIFAAAGLGMVAVAALAWLVGTAPQPRGQELALPTSEGSRTREHTAGEPAAGEPLALFSAPEAALERPPEIGSRETAPAPRGPPVEQPASSAEVPPVEPAPPDPSLAPPLTSARDLLARQFDLVGPGLPRAELAARSDTARLLFARTDLTAIERARAAYVSALAAKELGDLARCGEWVQRALDLNPTNRAYLNLRGTCRPEG